MMLSRPLGRWHGGKWLLAPWIIGMMPRHTVYVEPFGGMGSVLLRKPRAKAEVWNDLDGEAVNLFRVLRSPEAGRLIDAVRLTPFAREEFDLAYESTADRVERARRLLIRAMMGFGSNGHQRRTGFRSKGYRAGKLPQHDWQNYPEPLALIVERLRGVVIESAPALAVMARYDEPDTLHYVDPPYLAKMRGPGRDYAHELTEADHLALLDALLGPEGSVILSGYPSALYDDVLRGWHRRERIAQADGARPRTEVLWMNFEPGAAAPDIGLFREAAS